MKKAYTYILLILATTLFTGCSLITEIFSPNKVAGRWVGYEKGTDENGNISISATLSISESGTFTATFKHNDKDTEVSGDYSHSPAIIYPLSKYDEVGTIHFMYDGNEMVCDYIVTASFLKLENWLDDDGQIKALILHR